MRIASGAPYVVRSGDTLWSIAEAHGLKLDELLLANPGITHPGAISIGQVIMIPQTLAALAVPLPTLQRDMRGADVLRLQRALVHLGYLSESDLSTGPGVFGPATQQAVAGFQRAAGLAADGIYGPVTSNALGRALLVHPQPVTVPPAPQTTIRSGSRGEDVRRLQDALVYLGFMSQSAVNTGPGVFGPATEQAVKDFQRAKGLAVDGVCGPTTLAVLRASLKAASARSGYQLQLPAPSIRVTTVEEYASVAGQYDRALQDMMVYLRQSLPAEGVGGLDRPGLLRMVNELSSRLNELSTAVVVQVPDQQVYLRQYTMYALKWELVRLVEEVLTAHPSMQSGLNGWTAMAEQCGLIYNFSVDDVIDVGISMANLRDPQNYYSSPRAEEVRDFPMLLRTTGTRPVPPELQHALTRLFGASTETPAVVYTVDHPAHTFRGQCVSGVPLINPANIRIRSELTGASPEETERDVIANEIGHAVAYRIFGDTLTENETYFRDHPVHSTLNNRQFNEIMSDAVSVLAIPSSGTQRLLIALTTHESAYEPLKQMALGHLRSLGFTEVDLARLQSSGTGDLPRLVDSISRDRAGMDLAKVGESYRDFLAAQAQELVQYARTHPSERVAS